MDFLKSQLEAEQAASEELRRAAELGKARLDELRDEFRLRMQVCACVRACVRVYVCLRVIAVMMNMNISLAWGKYYTVCDTMSNDTIIPHCAHPKPS